MASGFAIHVVWEEHKAPSPERTAVRTEAARSIQDAEAPSAGPPFARPAAVATDTDGKDRQAEGKDRAGRGTLGLHGRQGVGSIGAGAGLGGAGQLWAKKMPGGGAAALLINHSPRNLSYVLNLTLLNMSKSIWGGYTVRDLWEHRDLPNASSAINLTVPPFDSKFLSVSPLV